jgi:hypothetical protein
MNGFLGLRDCSNGKTVWVRIDAINAIYCHNQDDSPKWSSPSYRGSYIQYAGGDLHVRETVDWIVNAIQADQHRRAKLQLAGGSES